MAWAFSESMAIGMITTLSISMTISIKISTFQNPSHQLF
jgi:hypothetical protein